MDPGNYATNIKAGADWGYPLPLVIVMWVISEIAAIATNLAEFLGGAIGLSLLFGIPLFWAWSSP